MTLRKVTSRLFTSGALTPDLLHSCTSAGISHILNVSLELDDTHQAPKHTFRLSKLGIYDNKEAVTDEWLSEVVYYGLTTVSGPEHRLLIHCKAGQNRSVTAAYAILRGFGIPKGTARYLLPEHTQPRYGDQVDNYIQRKYGA